MNGTIEEAFEKYNAACERQEGVLRDALRAFDKALSALTGEGRWTPTEAERDEIEGETEAADEVERMGRHG